MKKIKITFLSSAIFILSNVSHAQFGTASANEILSVKARHLAVCMEEGNEESLKRLANNPEKLKEYQDKLKYFNESLKSAISKTWKLNGIIEYLPFKIIEGVIKRKDKEYA